MINYTPGERNYADIITKNVMSTIFNRHAPLYTGSYKYLSVKDQASSGEAEANFALKLRTEKVQ